MWHSFPFSRAPLLRGNIVDVRSMAEIAATLDAQGKLDGLPFMPEMARHCGGRFKVHRRATKTCVEGLGLRRMHDTVLLEDLRCDGSSHDGCQRGCLMFWKDAWLRKVPADGADLSTPPADDLSAIEHEHLTSQLPTRAGKLYVCQSTALASATHDIRSWDISHLVRELIDGELTTAHFVRIVALAAVNKVRQALKLRDIGSLHGPSPKNPKGNLNLTSGERVAVKSSAEITATLDPTGRNAGLTFEPDMALCTGHNYEVDAPVNRIILEQTGEMRQLTSTVTLKGVVCTGLCAKNCPRANPIFWRESWLRRLDPEAPSAVGNATSVTVRSDEKAPA
jgi:hypothetical protein